MHQDSALGLDIFYGIWTGVIQLYVLFFWVLRFKVGWKEIKIFNFADKVKTLPFFHGF